MAFQRRKIVLGVIVAALVSTGTRQGGAQEQFFVRQPENLGPGVNSTSYELGGSMTADGLTIYFGSGRAGGLGGEFGLDIWMATRDDVDGTFGTAVNLGEPVNSPADDYTVWVSSDDLFLYFASPRGGGWDIWVARRDDPQDEFEQVEPIQSINSGGTELMGCVSCDGLELFFVSDRAGSLGGYDIWVATRDDPEDPLAFGNVRNVGSPVNSNLHEYEPFLSPDGSRLFFSGYPFFGDPLHAGGVGGSDLWIATRTGPDDPFDQLVNPGMPINSASHEQDGWLSCDEKSATLLFSSNRPRGVGDYDLWQARVFFDQPCPAPVELTRDIQPFRSPEEFCGDFRPGDEIPVELRVSKIREPGDGCEAPRGIVVRETPPADWLVTDISDGGTFSLGAIEWTLPGADLAAGRTLSYSVVAPAGGELEVSWEGTVIETDAAEEFNIQGEARIVKDAPFDECGGIRCWNILGALLQPYGDNPGDDNLRKDYLTDGSVTEADFTWIPGARVETDFSRGAASTGLHAGSAHRNPDGIPTVFAWNSPSGFIDLNSGPFAQDPDDVMAYAQAYVYNTTNRAMRGLFVESSSDDSIQVLLSGEEVWINSVARPGADACGPQDRSFLDATLDPGENTLVVKVFEGGGGWNFALRFIDEDGIPITDELEVRKIPGVLGEEPGPIFVRGDANADGSGNLADAVFILNSLFGGGGPPPCEKAADGNDDASVNVTDGIYLLSALFGGGAAPPAPFPDCGVDPTEDELSCSSFPRCE